MAHCIVIKLCCNLLVNGEGIAQFAVGLMDRSALLADERFINTQVRRYRCGPRVHATRRQHDNDTASLQGCYRFDDVIVG